MRRQIGEAIHDLQQAEQIYAEQTRTNRVARDVTRDLLPLSGLRPRPELRELAERFGVLPKPAAITCPATSARGSAALAVLALS